MSITAYWDKLWTDRCSVGDNGELRNGEKAKYILEKLWMKPEYIHMKKLDIGCGTCFHVASLMEGAREWGENYMGIDLSSTAIEVANHRGFNAHVMDISEVTETGFELFLLLDTLEHIEYHEVCANKIKEISAKHFAIYGNVPLYHSAHQIKDGGFEHKMDVHVVHKFIQMCGIENFYHKVYGIMGYPYMIFEAHK